MKWAAFGFGMFLFVGFTAYSLGASIGGWGLPGKLTKPVNIRQQSRSGGSTFIYFSTRRHGGGGYGYGK